MNRRFLASAVAVGLISLCLPRTLIAADLPVPTPVLDGVPTIGETFDAIPAPLPSVSIVGTNGQFVGISLDTAIGMALSQNLDILISESNHRISGYQIVANRGPFGLKLTLQPQLSRSKTPAVSPFSAGPGGGAVTSVDSGLNAGLAMKTLNGTNLSLSAGAQRIMSDSTSNAYDPYYQTSIAFNVTRSLGSGQFAKDRRDLVLSVIAQHEQADQTLITVSDAMTNVINTYWDLVAAWRNLGIQEEALAQAKAQSQSNQRLVRHGSAAPVDVVESNTQVDVDQDNVFSALQNVAMLQNRLKSLVLQTPGDPLWQVNFVPTSPLAMVPPEPHLDDLIVAGLIQRPELRLIAATMKRAGVAAEFARDESRPQVDLQLQVSANGFAGETGNLAQNPLFTGFNPLYTSVNALIAASNANLPAGAVPLAPVSPVAFTNSIATTGRFGTSWSSLFHNAYPVYSAQLNVALPLRNDRANGDRAIAHEQARQAQLLEAQAVTRIIMDARNAIQVFDAARQRLISAHAARLAADRVLLGEQRRFAVGRSTTFLVLQRQIVAANTQGREVQAQTDLNKAIAALDQVSGDLFTKHGIHVDRSSRAMVLQRLHTAGVPIDEGVLRPETSPVPSAKPTSSDRPLPTASPQPTPTPTVTPTPTAAPTSTATPISAVPLKGTSGGGNVQMPVTTKEIPQGLSSPFSSSSKNLPKSATT